MADKTLKRIREGLKDEGSDEGLTLKTSAKHHIPQATNIPYQPLLTKLIFSVLAHAEKQFFQN